MEYFSPTDIISVHSHEFEVIEQERVLYILKAVLNNDLAYILVQIRTADTRPTDTFFAVTGALFIFERHILHQAGTHFYVSTCYAAEYILEILTELCDRLLDLIKNEKYTHYPTVGALYSKEQKNDFFSKMFRNLFIYIFDQITPKKITKYTHEYTFKVLNTMEKIICVVQSCVFIDSGNFFENTFLPKMEEFLDSFCIECFSGAKVQIYNAKRAAYEYILRSVVLCNPHIDAFIIKRITKRWNAWFLLEHQYKISTKRFVKNHLREEMLRYNQ